MAVPLTRIGSTGPKKKEKKTDLKRKMMSKVAVSEVSMGREVKVSSGQMGRCV